jgi:hypothetical protein
MTLANKYEKPWLAALCLLKTKEVKEMGKFALCWGSYRDKPRLQSRIQPIFGPYRSGVITLIELHVGFHFHTRTLILRAANTHTLHNERKSKMQLSVYTAWRQTRRVEVYIHLFLPSALDDGKRQPHGSAPFSRQRTPKLSSEEEAGWATEPKQAFCGEMKNVLSLLGLGSRIARPVV